MLNPGRNNVACPTVILRGKNVGYRKERERRGSREKDENVYRRHETSTEDEPRIDRRINLRKRILLARSYVFSVLISRAFRYADSARLMMPMITKLFECTAGSAFPCLSSSSQLEFVAASSKDFKIPRDVQGCKISRDGYQGNGCVYRSRPWPRSCNHPRRPKKRAKRPLAVTLLFPSLL